MKKNAIIIAVLLGLVIIPVTCTFIFSGDEDDDLAGRYAPAPVSEAKPDAARKGGTAKGGGEKTGGGVTKVPVFKSFEGKRYQQFDRLIAKYVDEYNANRAKWAGATAAQAEKMPVLTAAQVKAHMIQETGGGDVRSRAAWSKDPLQVNVPGDWNPYKKLLGLREPRKRNEGSLETNLKAGIMLLARKGYGVAGQPASNSRKAQFDGWRTALQRYNGRSDKAANGRPYRESYADRILERAKKGEKTEVAIPIKTKK